MVPFGCQVALLARLASLSEQQVVLQLAGDAGSASRWAQLCISNTVLQS
jgi:hypothetical protein